MGLTIAWIAQGQLRLKTDGEAPRTVESRFGQSIRERAVRNQQRHAWKAPGEGESFLSGMMIWGNMISAQQNSPAAEETPDLVPDSWLFVTQGLSGSPSLNGP